MFPIAGILYAIIEPMNHEDFVVHGKPRALLPTIVEIHKHICASGGYYKLYFRDILRQPESGKVKPGGGTDTPEILQKKIDDIRVRKRELIKKLAKEGADIVVTSTYLAFCTFTGSAAWQPCTWRGRAFTSMWTMWCVIVVAAYTVREAQEHPHTDTHRHTDTHTHTHTDTQTNTHRRTHAHACTRIPTNIPTHIPTNPPTHTHKHTQTHTHTHTHKTHTHTQSEREKERRER
jgi:hypothetical protein